MDHSTKRKYIWVFLFAAFLAAIGLLLGEVSEVVPGLIKIMKANDLLISDYIAIAGLSGAFINVALVTFFTGLLLYLNKMPINGGTYFIIGLMSGFAFFGKNIFNIWGILLGTYIYCRIIKVPFSKYLIVSFMATALAPIASTTFMWRGVVPWGVFAAVFSSLVIGAACPIVSDYMSTVLKGYSLYNSGFALGLIALIITSILKSYGFEFSSVMFWCKDCNFRMGLMVVVICAIFLIAGFAFGGKDAWSQYRKLTRHPGTPPNDFVILFGNGAVMINVGINGLIALAYILLINGHVNGPTLGGIFTIMGFSAKGKTWRNIIPIFLGVALGGITKTWDINSPSAQLAALFGTTLAPISGAYGIVAGIIAGFLHSSVVQHAGAGYSGANLYNNGYAGGIVTLVLLPIYQRFLKEKKYVEELPAIEEEKKEDEDL